MSYLATTTVRIAADGEPNDLGDVVDGDGPLGEPIPVSLIEKAKKVYDETTSELRTVRWATGRVSANPDVAALFVEGARIIDQRTGKAWIIDSATSTRGLGGFLSTTLDLRAA